MIATEITEADRQVGYIEMNVGWADRTFKHWYIQHLAGRADGSLALLGPVAVHEYHSFFAPATAPRIQAEPAPTPCDDITTEWWGCRWMGVPYPIRWWNRLRWVGHPGQSWADRPDIHSWPGCGCLVKAKAALGALKFVWLRWKAA